MQKNNEKSFSNINTKSFITVLILLVCILIFSGTLSYFIPKGAFERDPSGIIIENSFTQGQVEGIAIWRVLTAPFRVFASEDALTIIFISLFLLIMSGVFNLLEKTKGIKIIIGKTVHRFNKRKKLVICIALLLFMLFGSFIGLFEELVTLLPLMVVFMLSMGFDTLTGVGICMLGACFGFSAAITNPFSVGLASNLANTYIFDGIWLRVIFFIIVYGIVAGFLLLHIRKITKNPELSPTYEIDLEKKAKLDVNDYVESEQDNKIFKIYGIFFLVQVIILVLIASIRAIAGLAIPLLSISFLVGGIICGLLICENKKNTFKYMLQGALSMLPAVLLIALAASVKLVMVESEILDTIMYHVINFLKGKDPFICILLIYLLILFLQIFIGSASAKIILIMPIILPIAQALGLSPTIVILTYCIADGFTDMILPTNPVLLIGLSMANVSYGKWVKWTWLLQVAVFILTILVLFIGIQINY